MRSSKDMCVIYTGAHSLLNPEALPNSTGIPLDTNEKHQKKHPEPARAADTHSLKLVNIFFRVTQFLQNTANASLCPASHSFGASDGLGHGWWSRD